LNIVYKIDQKIRTNEIDFNNRMKISSIFTNMQDAASEHAERLGFGFDDLKKHDLLWVLSWAKLEMNHYPEFGESISIETWPKCLHRIYAMRDYEIHSNGKLIGKSTSGWLLINSSSLRPTRPENYPGGIVSLPERIGLDEFPRKLPEIVSPTYSWEKKIGYSLIDVNKHMNNSNYVAMICDSYQEDDFNNRSIKSIEVTYLAETKLGDEVVISLQRGNEFDIVEIKKITTNKVHFRAIVHWFSY